MSDRETVREVWRKPGQPPAAFQVDQFLPPERQFRRQEAREVRSEPEEDPKMRLLRVAELTGQFAYKRKFCVDEKVFNRDYNEYLNSVPEELREEVKVAYWKGFKHGKRMNKNLIKSQCS